MIESLKTKAKRQADIDRRIQAAIAIDFYYNQQYDYMVDVIYRIYPKTASEIVNYINCKRLTEQIINDRSIIFKKPVKITIDTESESLQSLFTEVLDKSELWKKLIAIDRLSELTGKVGAAVHWHPIEKRVVVDIITPDTCFVVQDEHDPTKATDVYYQVGLLKDTHIAEPVNVYAHWNVDYYEKVSVNRDGIQLSPIPNTRIPNPYGRIPIVWFTAEPEVNSFWLDRGYPVVEANINLNLRETNLDLALDYQSFSTMVTLGRNEKDPLQLGVTRVLNLQTDPNSTTPPAAYYITPDAKLEAVSNIIQNKGINAAKAAGLSAESFTRDNSNVNSGYQLRLSKQDILDDNELKKEFYREPLRGLVHNITDCYTYNNSSVQFPSDIGIMIEFGTIAFDTNPIEVEQVRSLKLANKTISRIDIIMEDNPDLSREEAIEIAKRIDSESINTNMLMGTGAEWTPRPLSTEA